MSMCIQLWGKLLWNVIAALTIVSKQQVGLHHWAMQQNSQLSLLPYVKFCSF